MPAWTRTAAGRVDDVSGPEIAPLRERCTEIVGVLLSSDARVGARPIEAFTSALGKTCISIEPDPAGRPETVGHVG
jgi:hypothetical protein